MHLNVEIKAKCPSPEFIRKYLVDHEAEYKGKDYQTDTYFAVPNGRMKLRQGNIENALIHYSREDKEGPKDAQVTLFPVTESATLLQLLTAALGVKCKVVKQREIWFIDNVKFHLDKVEGLGSFVEIEAIDKEGSIGREKLLAQCNFYMNVFRINSSDLLNNSYSDMPVDLQKNNH